MKGQRIRGQVKEAPKAPKPGSLGKETYQGSLPGEDVYKSLTRILINYQGKETIISVKPKRLKAALVKYGTSVVRVLGKIKQKKDERNQNLCKIYNLLPCNQFDKVGRKSLDSDNLNR